MSVRQHVGAGLAALLGVADLVDLALLSTARQPGYVGPPVDVLGAAFVLLTLVAVALMLSRPRRSPTGATA